MTRPKLFLQYFICIALVSCSRKDEITGTWKRVDLVESRSDGTQTKAGDLVISGDSTFLIKGVDLSDGSNVPGWHSGGSMKGTWARPDKDHIILLPTEVDKRFASAFTYKIVTLDKTHLIMRSALDADATSGMTMKFTRQ